MNKLMAGMIFISLADCTAFAECTWVAKVTYPDREFKTYEIERGSSAQKIPIDKSKWTCQVKHESGKGTLPKPYGSGEKESVIETVDVTCTRNNTKFNSRVVCMKGEMVRDCEPFTANGAAFDLYDGTKHTQLVIQSK